MPPKVRNIYHIEVSEPDDGALCGLCGRILVPGPSINRHHLIPKAYGGTEVAWLHAICHSKIHSLFSDRELKDQYHSFEALLAHEEIQKFVRWVRRKEPTFYVRNRAHRRRRH